MTAVKICGLCHPEHALIAARAGAHMVGLVFAASRRQVSPEHAMAVVAALRSDPSLQAVRVVGLFVNEHPDTINAVARRCNLDYVQLSGDETVEIAGAIERPLIKSLRMDGTPAEAEWLELAAQHQDVSGSSFAPCPFIVDAHVPGAYGGTGTLADWSRASELAKRQRLMLAGGLTPDNVADAIQQVHPWGVDVSSGVETQGSKDKTLIEAFIRAVQSLV